MSIFSALFGKYPVQLLRLTAILQALKNSFTILKNIKNAFNKTITKELENDIISSISNYKSDLFLIDDSIALQANNLLQYFMKHKLILSGYNFDFGNIDFYFTIIDYIKSVSQSFDQNNVLPLNSTNNSKLNSFARKIFMIEEKIENFLS